MFSGDNAFNNKVTYNLEPVAANYNNPEYSAQMEAFDEELSELIIEDAKNREAMNIVMMTNYSQLPSANPPMCPIEFNKIIKPIEFIN